MMSRMKLHILDHDHVELDMLGPIYVHEGDSYTALGIKLEAEKVLERPILNILEQLNIMHANVYVITLDMWKSTKALLYRGVYNCFGGNSKNQRFLLCGTYSHVACPW